MMHKLYLLAFVLLLAGQSFAQTGDWETIVSSTNPTARHECSYVAVGNKFYLVGGRGTKPVQAYDPITNTWVSETNPPMQMHHFQAVSYQNKVYVAGAMTGNCCHETPVPNIYIYDPATKQWSIGPTIPSNRRRGGAGCVIVGNKLYLVCGIVDGHSSGWVNWMDSYDLQTNTWTQLANAPRERDHFHATYVDGKIYAIGGRRTGFNGNLFAHTIAEVDVYDIATNTWSTLPSSKNIPTQRAACPTAVIGDEILVIGGESAQVAHAQTEAFNVLTQTWRTLAPLDQSRHATSAVTYNNEVYIACGAGTRGGSMELSSQEKFSMTGGDPNGCIPNEVVSFTLMHAGTGGEIGELTEGMTINLATIGQFSIRANKCQNSGSVKFIVNGSTVRTESGAPYSINGDSNGNYTAWNPPMGSVTLVGTPYSQSGGGGSAGISKTVHFTVVNQPTGNVDCNGVQNGTAHLNSCGICVGGNTGKGENEGKDCNGVCNGSATLDDCGVCSGGNTGHAANSDKDACGVCFGNGSSCGGGCQPLQVTRLMLVHEGTAGEIGELTEGMTINLATMPKFSVRADVCSSAVKSVKFVLNGSTFRTESSVPFALNGDNNGSYTAWNPSVGAKTLTVNPYSQGGGGGTLGIPLTVHFTVVNQPTGTPDCNGVTGGSAHINSCGICVGGNTGKSENEGKDCNGVCNGSATLDDCGVCSGGNTGHAANSDKDACGVCFGNGSSCGGGCQPLQVTRLVLVRDGTAGEIGELTEGMTINLATMPKFSVRADVCSSAVKSVKFILNGSTFRTESSVPFALNGDNNGSYTAWNPSVGAKTLTANPYSQGGGGGTLGIPLTVHFTVVNQASGTPDCNGVTGGSAHLNSCGICVGGNTGLGENTGKDCNGVCNGSATLDDCGVCSGGNTGHAANSDKDACGVCFGNGSSCGGGCQPLEVTQLMLVHDGTGGDIGVLTEGMTIDLATMPDFSVRADVCSSAVKSVKFVLNGSTFRTESSAPFALNGDSNGSFYEWNPGTGAKTLTATPYSQGSAGGTAGISLTRHFTVVNSGAAKMEAPETDEPNKFFHVYPNPFSSQLTVEFSTLADTRARAEVVTKEGKVIAVVFDGETKAGKLYQETFQSETLANGMYFLRLHTESGETQMQKVLLMR